MPGPCAALAAALSDWESVRRVPVCWDRLAAAQDRLIAIEEQRVALGEDAPGIAEAGKRDPNRAGTGGNCTLSPLPRKPSAARALGIPPQALDGMSFTWPEGGGRRWTRTGGARPPSSASVARRSWGRDRDYAAAEKLH